MTTRTDKPSRCDRRHATKASRARLRAILAHHDADDLATHAPMRRAGGR